KRLILNNESIHCSQCMLSHLCIPQGLDTKETAKLDNLIKERLRVPKGRFLYQAKDSVKAVYSVRSGSFKTQLESKNGHLQITGFFLPGEIIGLDGLADESHLSHAIALEDSEVCVMHL